MSERDKHLREAEALAEVMRAKGFGVAPDLTVKGEDLAKFKGWSLSQLKRWRMNGRLPKADPLSKPARYSLITVAALTETGEIF